jgi:triacylglycerol lipase
MTFSFRRVGVAAAALIAAIGVGVAGAPPPAGALQGADTLTLAQHRCIARASYDVFLDRAATEEEKTEWADDFATGTAYSALPDALANSDEWLGKVVTDLYQMSLERDPSPEDETYWGTQLESGVKVNTVGASIFGSLEFFTNKASSSNTTYVQQLYARILDRTGSTGDVSYWVSQIPIITRGGVASRFFGTPESRGIRVEALYQDVLGRAADAPGKAFWVDELEDINDIQVAVELASLSEFRTRAHGLCNPTIGTYYPLTLGTPLDPSSNPTFTVPLATMDGTMPLSGAGCMVPSGASTTGETVLLVAQPGQSAEQWRAALDTAGRLAGLRRVCRLDLPTASTSPDPWDATRSAQYVARAISRLHFWYSGPVDVVADGLGGLSTRWALRWWPTIRAQVDDVVTIGVPNHGSVDTMYDATTTPTAISQQSRADSAFIKALNSSDETPGGGWFTNIASGTDHVSVGDGSRDLREHAWHLNGATNIRVQNSCPALVLRRTAVRDNAWVWAAVKDALVNTGTASTTRLASTPCGANAGSDSLPTLGTTVVPDSEPPLPTYVPVADPETAPHTALTGLPTTDPGAGSRTLTEPLVDRDAAIVCPTGVGVARYAQSPTLLVPGGLHEDDGEMFASLASRFSDDDGGGVLFPVCWLNVPDGGIWDQQVVFPNAAGADLRKSSQYVVHAVLEMYADHGVDVDLIGHSRGGFDIAWATKWWPDVQARVDDVVLVDTPIRGSGLQRYATPSDYFIMGAAIGHQTRSDSRYMAALRIGDLTPGTDVSWTTVWTWDDGGSGASRSPGYDTRQNAWRWGDAANVVLQGQCAGTPANHGTVLTGALGWTVIADALEHTGGALPSRFMVTTPPPTCGTTWRQHALVEPDHTLTLQTNTEPALPGYVWNTP